MQQTTMQLNHVLVRTSNLRALSQLMTEIIGLEIGDRPPFPFAGTWFYSNGQALIHAVEGRAIGEGSIAHVALTGANYEQLLTNLQTHGVRYSEKDVPSSGERQVFITGPDGLVVEMLFPLSTNTEQPEPYRLGDSY